MDKTLVECRELTKKYGSKYALNGLNLSLESGKIIGLIGPNGSGKTTLIKLLNGLLVPASGEISIDGHSPGIETKKIISYLPDQTYLASWQSADQIINTFTDFYSDFDAAKAREMLKEMNIKLSDKISTLSKGMSEKLQLALVMSRNARLYILDEPLGGVDPAAREYILHTILTNYSDGASLLISTHLVSDVEKILDDVIMLKEGKVHLHMSAEAMRSNYNMSLDEMFKEEFRC